MTIIAWVIFEIMMGIIANSLDPDPAYGGILGAIFLGLAGALIGGIISLIFSRSGIVSSVNLTTLLIALSGSFIVLMREIYMENLKKDSDKSTSSFLNLTPS